MKVLSIEAAGFMRYAHVNVRLPERGVVLVTGHNGAGKSSLVEAVSHAIWGKGIRGNFAWGEGRITVATDGFTVQRTRKGTRSTVKWAPATSPVLTTERTFESTTKAVEALEEVAGDWDLWRRTHVFSSSDAALFTLSTDADRKRLLEVILGLDRFESALESCRTDLSDARASHARQDSVANAAAGALETATARLAEAEQQIAAHEDKGDPDALEARAVELRRMILDADRDIRAIEGKRREHQDAASRAEQRAQAAQARLSKLGSVAACPTCLRGVDESMLAWLREVADGEASKAASEREVAAEHTAGLAAQLDELRDERDALRAILDKVAPKAAVARSARDDLVRARAARERLVRHVEAARAELSEAVGRRDALAREVAELEACAAVLGTRGVRAHVLGRALAGVERVANAWLARIAGPGFAVRLRSTSETKSGKVTDVISLDVDGAGGGHGYRASSGGERRRIDVALLVALAEVARAAHGRPPGTLFFDEVFDALDADGVDLVAGALADVASDRAVVLITHSDDLARRVRADVHLRVRDGGIEAS